MARDLRSCICNGFGCVGSAIVLDGGGAGTVSRLQEVYGNVSPLTAVSFIVCVYLYRKFLLKAPVLRSALVLSLLFGSATVFAASFRTYGDWRLVFYDGFQLVLSMVGIVGYACLYYIGLSQLYLFLDRVGCARLQQHDVGNANSRDVLWKFVNRHFLIISTVLVLVAWLPLLILYLPGSVTWDGARQLNMAFGYNDLTNHHPVLVTFLYGALMTFGRDLFGSDSAGIFTIVLFQMLFAASSMGLCCSVMQKGFYPRWLPVATLLYFMLNPVLICYFGAVLKDVLSATLFLLFALLVFELWRKHNEGGFEMRYWALFFVCALALSFSRNNCVYIVLGTLVIGFFGWKRLRKELVFSACAIVLCYSLWNFIALPAFGVASGSIGEALSVPFQQTARYLVTYPDEVTEEERTAIDGVLRYDEIAKNYNSDSSDLVKRQLRPTCSSKDLARYFKTWVDMFVKHPGVYVESMMIQVTGYMFPQVAHYNNTHFLNERSVMLDDGEYNVPFVFDESIRTEVATIVRVAVHVPVFGLLQTSGAYAWVVMIALFYCAHRQRWDAIPVLVPALLTILVCVASPLNGSLRYMLPVIIVLPIIVALCVSLSEEQCDQELLAGEAFEGRM